MKIRPHHALCMQFFEGKGYSEDFTKNMWRVLALPEDTVIEITTDFDELCSHCPNHPEGVCLSEQKVRRYDTSVMKICGFNSGDIYTIKEFKDRAKTLIVDKNLISQVCTNCEFLYICNKKHC